MPSGGACYTRATRLCRIKVQSDITFLRVFIGASRNRIIDTIILPTVALAFDVARSLTTDKHASSFDWNSPLKSLDVNDHSLPYSRLIIGSSPRYHNFNDAQLRIIGYRRSPVY